MKTLAEVYDEYRLDPRFDHLRTDGIVLVPGEGSPVPKIFIVGEAPGATENLQRRPFVGASGRALRSLIGDSAGLDPTDWFLTNTVKYRPPGNRTPTRDEIAASVSYLRAEYAAVGSPPVLVAVGNPARIALAPDLIGGTTGLAGRPYSVHGKWIWVMVHPRYALTNRKYRPTMESHWETLGEWFRKEFG
jgi:uracil-DNA glycosylase